MKNIGEILRWTDVSGNTCKGIIVKALEKDYVVKMRNGKNMAISKCMVDTEN